MIRHVTACVAAMALLAASAHAQEQPRPPRPNTRPTAAQPRSRGIRIAGVATIGGVDLAAQQSFDAILGTHRGPIAGGGVRVGLPFKGLFAEVGAWRFHDRGERVFVLNGTRYPLGIKESISLTPIELSGGWQFRVRRAPKLLPYLAVGVTSMRYQESSDFAASGEDVDENFGGYHLYGGAEYKIIRWLGVAGEFHWTAVPGAIGEAGVSKAFGESNLGGTSLRVKFTVGR